MKRFIIATAIVAATIAAPALAASDTFKMEIAYTADNLATRSGAEAEYDSIRQQVAERCKAEMTDRIFAGGYARTFCISKTMDRTVLSIDNPQLTAVHAEHR